MGAGRDATRSIPDICRRIWFRQRTGRPKRRTYGEAPCAANRTPSNVSTWVRSGEFRRLPGSDLDPDWGSHEFEGAANLVFQETLVGKVQLDLAVGEEDECGWGDGGLGEVKNFYALAD